jgi:starch synthase (maltosyl-transferring)
VVTTSSAAAPARPVIEDVRPRVEDGRYDAKAIVGDAITIEADAFVDGHDILRVEVHHRPTGTRTWSRQPMVAVGNDRWRAAFRPAAVGRYQFLVKAQVDHFATWRRDLAARIAAGQDVSVERIVGVELARAAASRAKGKERATLFAFADDLADGELPDLDQVGDVDLGELVARHGGSPAATSPTYGLYAERPRARFSTWYELFPRSMSPRKGKHGTLTDVIGRLDYLDYLGIDVLYLPPIHPIGSTARKGRNGTPKAERSDVGSPWAIGSADGGHTAVHRDLGTVADLTALVEAAAARGIDVAIDIAFQCSPDHPWVTEHPEWFKHRPDGSIRYAENPPKKYEDVYPIDFETDDWRALWDALREVIDFWIAAGVKVFRVDNPHTKPFAFWEWLIPALQSEHEGLIFLAEAFTRPKIMKRLGKLGFTQSYTYFAWRTAKWEFEQYLTELTRTDVADYYRPNFWPNTPDILTEQLQRGDARTFRVRVLLAGTLAASYGIYGPVFELVQREPRFEGSEEYLDSEKYEIRQFELESPTSIAPFLRRLNAIRHACLPLQHNDTLAFHWIDNDQLMAYSKTLGGVAVPDGATAESVAAVLVVVNLDTAHKQAGWLHLDLDALGLDREAAYVVHDLLNDARYEWEGSRNFVMLDPAVSPAHIFRIAAVEAGGS